MSPKIFEEKEVEPLVYAKRSELVHLSAVVDSLIIEFRETKQHMMQLSMDLARETGKFSIEIERLGDVLDKMQMQIGKLVDTNIRRSIIIEWVKSSPKFISIIFGFISIIGLFFTTDAHRDFFHYLISLEKAKYGQVLNTDNTTKANG